MQTYRKDDIMFSSPNERHIDRWVQARTIVVPVRRPRSRDASVGAIPPERAHVPCDRFSARGHTHASPPSAGARVALLHARLAHSIQLVAAAIEQDWYQAHLNRHGAAACTPRRVTGPDAHRSGKYALTSTRAMSAGSRLRLRLHSATLRLVWC